MILICVKPYIHTHIAYKCLSGENNVTWQQLWTAYTSHYWWLSKLNTQTNKNKAENVSPKPLSLKCRPFLAESTGRATLCNFSEEKNRALPNNEITFNIQNDPSPNVIWVPMSSLRLITIVQRLVCGCVRNGNYPVNGVHSMSGQGKLSFRNLCGKKNTTICRPQSRGEETGAPQAAI